MPSLNSAEVIHIVLASDANYAMPMAVAICSAAASCDRASRLQFHVIQSRISPELRRKIEFSLELTGAPRARICWVEAGALLKEFPIIHRNHTELIYARLLIPNLLPQQIEKALYLDSDLVVRGNISELWNMPFEEKSLLAARDRIGFVGAPSGIANHRELGIPADAPYFNSGVLLMNLSKWREVETSERVFNYLREYRDVIRMEDQEALNAVLFGDWGELDFGWNWQIPWREYRLHRATPAWVPQTERRDIVHFPTSEKPWLPGCDYEERAIFFGALDKTAWAGWRVPLLNELVSRTKRACREAIAPGWALRVPRHTDKDKEVRRDH
jgi:lipopolysaccharide biosynthesis glycosyltransferase